MIWSDGSRNTGKSGLRGILSRLDTGQQKTRPANGKKKRATARHGAARLLDVDQSGKQGMKHDKR